MKERKTKQLYIKHGGGDLQLLAKRQALLDINESVQHRELNETYCFVGRRSLVISMSKYPEQIINL